MDQSCLMRVHFVPERPGEGMHCVLHSGVGCGIVHKFHTITCAYCELLSTMLACTFLSGLRAIRRMDGFVSSHLELLIMVT